MVLFTTALPIASFCSLVECHVGSRAEAWLLLRMKQRAMPLGADDIGTWMSVFQILSMIAVATNAGLIVFTMDVLDYFIEFSMPGKLWIFIGFQWFFLVIQQVIQKLIPDVTDSAIMQAARNAFIVSKILDKVADDDVENDVDDDDEEAGEAKGKKSSKPAFAEIVKSYPSEAPSSEIELVQV